MRRSRRRRVEVIRRREHILVEGSRNKFSVGPSRNAAPAVQVVIWLSDLVIGV